ncbi:MAG TPA: alpha/beta hydrolase [Noviherbaspirillum sp.]|nr:alpha/beta hydrolase [Noviherbaspirillum sp.]
MNPKRHLSKCPPDACQAQYFLRGVFTDFPQILARWQADSAAARARLPCEPDLAYAEGELCRVDVFPAREPDGSMVVFLHGGYWQGGDKSDVSFIAAAFVEHGVSVAIPNYSLAPKASIDTMLAETRAAFEWLGVQAPRWSVDPARIVALGHSAGGQLAAMMLTDAWAPRLGGRPLVRHAFAISGLYDLRPLRHTVLNDALGLSEESAARLSPVDHLQAHGLLHPVVGELETREFHVQAALAEASWPNVAPTLSVPCLHHYTILDPLVDPASVLFGQILAAARQ